MYLYFFVFLLMGAVILIVTHPLTILLHEFGHAIPALLFTREKVIIYIGTYGKQDKSLHFTIGRLEIWVKKMLFWKKGMCVCYGSEMSFIQEFIFLICGPIASLAFTFTIGYFVFEYDMHGALKLILAFYFFAGAFDFIWNIFPNKRPFKVYDDKIAYNDGQMIKRLFYNLKFSKEYKKAIALYKAKNYIETSNLLDNILSKGVVAEDVYRVSICCFLEIKNYKRALEISNIFKKNFSFTEYDYYQSGVLKSRLHQFEECITEAKIVLELNSNHLHALNLIGYALTNLGKYEEAKSYLEKAISIDENYSYAYNNLGFAKMKLGLLEEGFLDIQHALKLDATGAYNYRNVGIYYLEKNNKQEALINFYKAKEIESDTYLIDELIQQGENL